MKNHHNAWIARLQPAAGGGFATVWLPTGSLASGPHGALVMRESQLGPNGPTFRGVRLEQGGSLALGQRLLLRYGADDYNCLHQDLYGEIVFPFQVVFCLSRPREEFTGGEWILVEQQPRAQSMGQVIRLEQGDAVVITTRYRPAKGSRGYYRTNFRHGVSPVESGERYTLGVIFHDAA